MALCITTQGPLGREGAALTSVLGTWFSSCVLTCIHSLSFQTLRQYSEATNESNRVFLYCAFLDFRYCCLRSPGKDRAGEWGEGGGRGWCHMGVQAHAPSHASPGKLPGSPCPEAAQLHHLPGAGEDSGQGQDLEDELGEAPLWTQPGLSGHRLLEPRVVFRHLPSSAESPGPQDG